jgi:hypothetical protein
MYERNLCTLATCALGALLLACSVGGGHSGDDETWRVHDMSRPQPEVVTPGTPSLGKIPGNAPSDALILFDGNDLDAWTGKDGKAPWMIDDGVIVIKPGSGDMMTRRKFGDVQYHMEWMVPADRKTSGQKGGNSGLFLMDRYEIQILDSHENKTYPDGMAASFYGQHPPAVNPTTRKGTWNTYDVIFRAPRWDAAGTRISPARATVLFNGVMVHDSQTFKGPTESWKKDKPHGPDVLRLQDHQDPIHFRNIWVRDLSTPEGET